MAGNGEKFEYLAPWWFKNLPTFAKFLEFEIYITYSTYIS